VTIGVGSTSLDASGLVAKRKSVERTIKIDCHRSRGQASRPREAALDDKQLKPKFRL
jgi:hypothetical protein